MTNSVLLPHVDILVHDFTAENRLAELKILFLLQVCFGQH